ncbi:MAG: DMT family transporter [Alphaproteobacteria bacterium]
MAQITAPAPTRAYQLIGYSFAALGTTLFAIKGILIKLAYGDAGGAPAVDAITLLALRMMFSLPVYIVIGAMAWRNHVRSGNEKIPLDVLIVSIAVGIIGYYLSAYLDFVGLLYLSVQLERLILYTYPMFVMVLGAIFFGYSVTMRGVLALLIAYAGIGVIFGGGATASGEHTLYGAAFVMTGAITFAGYQLVAASVVRRMGPWLFTCVAMMTASAATLIHFSIVHSPGDLFTQTPRIYWLVAVMAVFATIMPTFMINAALGRINAQAVATIGTISPVATIIMAVVIIGEPFTFIDALGTALVLIGVGLFTLADARRKRGAG